MIGLGAMTEPRAYTVVRITRVLSSFLIALGILGLLRTLSEDVAEGEKVTLFTIVVHPASSAVYLLIGLVGTAMATTAGRAQRFLGGLAPVMLVWALLGAGLSGDPVNALSGEISVVLLHVGLALVAGAVVWLPERSRARLAPADVTVPEVDIPAPAHARSREELSAGPDGDAAAGLGPEPGERPAREGA